MHSVGRLAGVWFTQSVNLQRCPVDVDFVVAELEDEDDYRGCLAAIGHLPDVPRAVLTSFTPLSEVHYTDTGVPFTAYLPDKAKPLIDAGFHCLTECYLGENPNATPPRMDFTGRVQLRWPRTQPVFGVYGGAQIGDYAAWMTGAWGAYIVENVL